jgi:integrase
VEWSDALLAVVERAKAAHQVASIWLVATARGQRYTASGIHTAWQRLIVGCVTDGIIPERFTFHDLRAKARSDGTDKHLLGHADPEKMARTYQRKPVPVRPTK